MMEEKIKQIGKAFRGLWFSRPLNSDTGKPENKWSTSFMSQGDLIESDFMDTPHAALDVALRHGDKEPVRAMEEGPQFPCNVCKSEGPHQAGHDCKSWEGGGSNCPFNVWNLTG